MGRENTTWVTKIFFVVHTAICVGIFVCLGKGSFAHSFARRRVESSAVESFLEFFFSDFPLFLSHEIRFLAWGGFIYLFRLFFFL